MVILNEQCSAKIMHEIPTKMTDSGSLNITFEFRKSKKINTLADLGAGINLMPYLFFKKFNLLELKPTRMAIHMSNRFITYPQGIMEDLLVKFGEFVFLVDFVVLNMKKDEEVPVILGRPFLSIVRSLVDIHDSKYTLRVGSKEITFVIGQTNKSS